MSNNIAIFAYNWSNPPYSKLDIYLDEFVKNFSKLGLGVDVYIANEYVKSGGLFGISSRVNVRKLDKYIASRNYKFIISVNNALLTKRIKSIKNQKVISLIVDDFNHLFNHDCSGLYDQFQYANDIVFSSFSHIEQLKLHNSNLHGSIHFLATATSPSTNSSKSYGQLKKHNISIVANLLDSSDFALGYRRCINSPKKTELLQRAVTAIRDNNPINYEDCIGDVRLGDILNELKWTKLYFEMKIQNLISNESRITITEKLDTLGLTLYGNDRWLAASAFYPKVLDYFHSGEIIASHSDIMEIYNSSKICINIPQVQTRSALPYRVIDILASDALLITQFHPESDLFTMFGKDCPVLMYKNLEELVSICNHYLSHEDERQLLINRCNALVETGFSFKERCLDLIKISNIDYEKNNNRTGEISYIDSFSMLTTFEKARIIYKKIRAHFKEHARRLAKHAVKI